MNLSKRHQLLAITALAFAFLATLPGTASAGPPLICHPFEIGDAPSLPWGDKSLWHGTSSRYSAANLATDTLELLDPEAAVLTRMETLRRAAVYARPNPGTAVTILNRLMARVLDQPKDPERGALAWFDAGYFVETFKQAALLHREQARLLHSERIDATIFRELDGYDWILKAIALSKNDPGLQFGAAMVQYRRPGRHVRSALDLAEDGGLLRQNLERSFPQQISRR